MGNANKFVEYYEFLEAKNTLLYIDHGAYGFLENTWQRMFP